MADSRKLRGSFPGRINKYAWIGVAAALVPALATLGNLSWVDLSLIHI